MSNIALSWAFRCHVGNASAKAVLVYLADRASDDGTAAFPKIETIVNVTELSERTVRSSLKLLQERGFIRRGDQRYARLGKGGRTRLPQYCQIVWDLAVESDPATLTWIKETHAAEQDISTMSETVAPEAGIVPETMNPRTCYRKTLERSRFPALQISQGWKTTRNRHCKSRTPGTANLAPLALQMPQGCYIRIKPSMKTLHVNHTPLSLRESSPQAGSAPPGRMEETIRLGPPRSWP